MKHIHGILIGLMIMGLAGCGPSAPLGAEEAAVEATLDWLSLIDDQQYDESWDQAAGIFKTAVPREQWNRSMRAIRQPLGKNISRAVKSKQYMTSLPGAPDGEYVVLQFKTSFEKKKSAVETVTPMMDADGQWRVSGYYIK